MAVLLVMAGLAVVLLGAESVFAGKLEEAIAAAPQGTGAGQIDPGAAKGYLGIPGAPSPNLIAGLL